MKRSAGLLLWRRTESGALEVLLAHPGGPFFARRDDAHWSIPKGEVEPGEDEWKAAQREFSEELGIPVPAGEATFLGEHPQRRDKINVIWALEADPGPFEVNSNLFDLEWPPRSGTTAQFPEVDRAAWFDLATAHVKIFGAQRFFLDQLEQA